MVYTWKQTALCRLPKDSRSWNNIAISFNGTVCIHGYVILLFITTTTHGIYKSLLNTPVLLGAIKHAIKFRDFIAAINWLYMIMARALSLIWKFNLKTRIYDS